MFKLASAVLLLALVALTLAEPRAQPQLQQQLRSASGKGGAVVSQHPYLFLSVPRGRAGTGNVLQGFHIVEENDDDDEDNETQFDADDDELVRNVNMVDYDNDDDDAVESHNDDDDDDEYVNDNFSDNDVSVSDEPIASVGHMNVRERFGVQPAAHPNMQLIMKNAKSTHMMVSRDHAGAIMVPDGIIEIEGQSVYDEKTGKAALLVPRAALDAIPDGSVVALMERSLDESEEERANRVVVRRRRKGSRRNVKRRRSGGGRRRRRGGSNKRRRGNKRPSVRVYNAGGATRRRGNRRGNRPMIVQG